MRSLAGILLLFSTLAIATPANAQTQTEAETLGLVEFQPLCDTLSAFLETLCWSGSPVYVKSTDIQGGRKKNSTLVVTFNQDLAFHPFRDGDIEKVYTIVKSFLPEQYAAYSNNIRIMAGTRRLDNYKPIYYSTDNSKIYINEHYKFVTKQRNNSEPLVSNLSRQYSPGRGLNGAHIALWQSHGLYFERSLERWEWQRSRFFGTVEDRFTQSFVIPFLVPMLENAGATVLMPRERDINPNEVIVETSSPTEFASTRKKSDIKLVTQWIPEIPERGEYGVYVSYPSLPNSAEDARYLVRHKGGETWFSVNQKMCGQKWVYLGKFLFEKGRNEEQGVFLSNYSKANNVVISGGRVRFGGGIGPSGHPRHDEASIYWLKYAGYPESVYSDSHFTNDYKDDIKARGNWVNYLKNQDNVPVDLAMAFHTDAGIRTNDSIVGTLAIYTSRPKGISTYPSGEERMVCKEYADIVQSQVVSDIRSIFGVDWTRRGLWDKSYAESSYPEVPTMLLELLSHQNFWDMRYGLDPNFKFVVSRAVYKGILRFYSYLNEKRYVIQPLPVSDFSVSLSKSGNGAYARLKWTAEKDPLESSATPDYFIVYTRIDDGGFDNGRKFNDTNAAIEIQPGHLYSFKVEAVNEGGASFPSQTLCAAVADKSVTRDKKMLIINNFNSIGPAKSFITADSTYAGFRYESDPGIPYMNDISYCGPQYEFNRNSEWMDDDYPGFGASLSDMETSVIAGNTFDFVSLHSQEALRHGYDIVSSSSRAFSFGQADTSGCAIIDLICGRKGSGSRVFDPMMQRMLTSCSHNGCGLIISGSDIASDASFRKDSLDIKWFNGLTSSKLITWYATSVGEVKNLKNNNCHSFFTAPNPVRYCVPQPDAIIPARKNCTTIYRYAGNNISAGTFRNDSCKVVTLGFPIEALTTQGGIDALMAELLGLFE